VTIIVDNCLPLSWAEYLCQRGHSARHWREVGPSNAPDADILRWARQNEAVVLTQDLDFTRLLFQTRAALPSVIQLRLDDVRPKSIGEEVILILGQHGDTLRRGAVITVKGHKSRLRILPLDGVSG
jgi:predicted nuclease of predicted toxin-antitoxin system